MTYRSLLLHLDDRGDVARSGPALDLARLLGALDLTVVAAGGVTPPGHGVPVGPGLLLLREREIRDAFADMKSEMEGLTGALHLDWRSDVTPDPTQFVLDQSARADLLIVTRPAPGSQPLGDLDLGRLLAGAGRPVLIRPDATRPMRLRKIAIGYKRTRESRLAVAAALPLLKQADTAVVIGLGPEAPAADLVDVVAQLGRHGVFAETLVRPGSPVSGEALAGAAASVGADLLVCGAYGRGRAREFLFGGVTRDLIASCDLPCLMIH